MCLDKGPEYVLDKILERRDEVRELCEYLDIETQQEDKETLIGIVVSRIMQYDSSVSIQKGVGFAVLKNYIDYIATRGQQTNAELALRCANLLERLIKEMYNLYIGGILYLYLNDRDKHIVRRVLKSKSVKFGTRVSQLRRFEAQIESNPSMKDILMDRNGQKSLFGLAELDDLQKVSSIRAIIAHENDNSPSEIRERCRELFDRASRFVNACVAVMPKVVFPIHFGVTEWKSRYIAYIGEDDLDTYGSLRSDCGRLEGKLIRPELCSRYYLLEKPTEYRPYQKAYFLHPDHDSRIKYDPTIFYAADLLRIGEQL